VKKRKIANDKAKTNKVKKRKIARVKKRKGGLSNEPEEAEEPNSESEETAEETAEERAARVYFEELRNCELLNPSAAGRSDGSASAAAGSVSAGARSAPVAAGYASAATSLRPTHTVNKDCRWKLDPVTVSASAARGPRPPRGR